MKTIRTLSVALLAMSLAACGATGEAGEETVAFASFNLEAEDGGFDESAEAAMAEFEAADPEAFESEGAEVAEPGIDAEIAAMDPAATRYEIRILWGQRALADQKPPTVWDGAVATTTGALRVVRAIRFEQNDAVLPRTSPQSVEFESTTTIHHDGLRLRLVVPPASPDPAVKPELIIGLGDLPEVRIPHARLRHLVRARKVDDLGNGVSIIAFEHTGCARGMVGGHWRRTNENGGILGGRVQAANGQASGRLFGIWGVRADGTRRFFGLLVRDGAPTGVVRGTWRPLENGVGGLFRGHWVTQGEHRGILAGHYRPGPNGGQGRFHGLFAERCDASPLQTAGEGDAPADLCSADGLCVAEPTADCDADDCADATDL